MVQFKNVFTGVEASLSAPPLQKCVRARGKHNDLDNVGYTARHHLLRDARQLLVRRLLQGSRHRTRLELRVTKEFGPLKDKLTATVCVDDDEGVRSLEEDSRPAGIAHHPDRRGGQFQQMGDTGPCGPCSEIFTTTATRSGAGRRARPSRMATASSRSNLCSCSMSSWKAARAACCRSRRSIPAPASNAARRGAAGQSDNYDIDLFVALIRASRADRRRSAGAPEGFPCA